MVINLQPKVHIPFLGVPMGSLSGFRISSPHFAFPLVNASEISSLHIDYEF